MNDLCTHYQEGLLPRKIIKVKLIKDIRGMRNLKKFAVFLGHTARVRQKVINPRSFIKKYKNTNLEAGKTTQSVKYFLKT